MTIHYIGEDILKSLPHAHQFYMDLTLYEYKCKICGVQYDSSLHGNLTNSNETPQQAYDRAMKGI